VRRKGVRGEPESPPFYFPEREEGGSNLHFRRKRGEWVVSGKGFILFFLLRKENADLPRHPIEKKERPPNYMVDMFWEGGEILQEKTQGEKDGSPFYYISEKHILTTWKGGKKKKGGFYTGRYEESRKNS